MLENILDREDVKSFLADVITNVRYNSKDIPNTICEEKISQEEYSFYVVIDAIIKYFIIIDNNDFEDYFEQIKRIMKKIQNHNDIVLAINRALIKAVKRKLNIKDDNQQSKQIIIDYIYDKYIKNGYLFCSVLDSSYDKNNNQLIDNYYSNTEIEELYNILNKYKIENNLDKYLDYYKENYKLTDSVFMTSFYAYNCPFILYELCNNIIANNSKKEVTNNNYFFKEYHTCNNALDSFLKKKEVLTQDKNKILNFFKEKCKCLNMSTENIKIIFIKRSKLYKDSIELYNQIIDNNDSLDNIIKSILSVRFNDIKIKEDIIPDFSLAVPNINSLLNKEQAKEESEITKVDYSLSNSYGSATIIALCGILLIALGVIMMIIMIGR